MLHRKLTGFLLGVLVVSLASFAMAGVPDLGLSTATTAAPANSSVFNLPNGAGDPMTAAKSPAGATVNATITLTLVDQFGDPIAFYPSEDLWLDTSGGSFNFCANGTAANLSTDINGITRWINPLFAGGNSPGQTVNVYVAGLALNHPGLAIIFNSADINGDLTSNVTDLTPFATDYFGAYNYRSDFVRDGSVNVSDLTQFARGYGSVCP
jgi:hypothetical protein